MFDWVIEADIYQLRKAINETTDPQQRRELTTLAEQKEIILARRGAGKPMTGRELS
ncbi:MAG TPA: hypothetical protein VIL42_04140 [Sphingomicrobium sp.]|jgi:hypothetical protein